MLQRLNCIIDYVIYVLDNEYIIFKTTADNILKRSLRWARCPLSTWLGFWCCTSIYLHLVSKTWKKRVDAALRVRRRLSRLQ